MASRAQDKRMASKAQDTDAATQLHSWATKEMHFFPQGAFQGAPMPTPDDLKRICRGAHQADLWKYVIDYVRSVQTVKKVKGNLQLKARSRRHGQSVKNRSEGGRDNEQQNLVTQRDTLQGEITAVLSQSRQLERELERMESDVQKAEAEYQKETESIRDVGRMSCLLRVYTQTSDNFNNSIDAFADRIDSRADFFVKRQTGVNAALHTRPDDESEGGSTAAQLETTTAKEVRASCNQIAQFLHQTLQGTFGKDKSSFNLNKDQLWKQMETTLSDHNIHQIVASLVRHSQQGAQALREHTLNVSIYKDAEKLRFDDLHKEFKYEKGGILRDTSEEPTILQSVHQLLEENQMQHVMRFVETEKHHNAARPLLENLANTRSKISELINKQFSAQPRTEQLANTLVQCQLDVTGDRTAKDVYRQQAETLREKVAAGQAQRDALLTLHQKIQDFQLLANAKQSLIQVVAKQNSGAKSRLYAQQFEATEYIGRSIPSHQPETFTVVSELRGSVTQEGDKFSSLSLPYLAYLYLDSETKCSLLDLSIHHSSHPTAISVRQPLHASLTHLHFPPYKAAECILQHCQRLKQEQQDIEELTHNLQSQCSKVTLGSGVQTDMDNISELCVRVRAQDKEELATLLPVINKRITKAARASTDCIRVKDCVNSWWEQPAQFTTPWVKVENMTFQQWYSQWRIIATKIRQLIDVQT